MSGQAIPPITVEEIVALGEKILITTVCGESNQSLFTKSIFTRTLLTLAYDVILQ